MKLVLNLSLVLMLYLYRETLSDGLQCVCVAYDDCYHNFTLKSTVTDFHEVRTYYENRPRPSCTSAIDVCCNLRNNNSNTNTFFLDSTSKTPPVERWACGYRNTQGADRDFGESVDAQPGEFPWMVAVLRKDATKRNRNGYHCGGSLINEKAVLTSAREVHKVKAANLVARLGLHDWNSKNERYQDIQVEHVHIHPRFNVESLIYNYAILILARPAKSDARVNSICLPTSHDDYDLSHCIETGWGKDRAAVNQRGSTLKKSELYVMNRRTCQGIYRMTYDNDDYKIHRSVLCAADDQLRAPCTGNGGSPIICPLKRDENRYVQVGVASIAVCKQRYKPGLYADVSAALQWVNSVIDSSNLESNSYTA